MSVVVKTLIGKTVATFERRDDAVLCLPAMARILCCSLVIEGGDRASVPIPNGCTVMERVRGGGFRLAFRVS